MLVRYVTICDPESPRDPDNKRVSQELEQVISKIEKDEKVRFISACFIERKLADGKSFTQLECYRLFFR